MILQPPRILRRVGPDGILRLEIPTPFKDEDVEVEIILRPLNSPERPMTPEELGWPPGFFEQTAGSIPDFPEIEPEGDYEERKALD